MPARRRFAMGAEYLPGEGTSFRVWAPDWSRLSLVLESTSSEPLELRQEGNGYFHLLCREARPGTQYRFRLGDRDEYPDPASRYQPQGPFGPSEVVDPTVFPWTDDDWPGVALPGQVIYEMHIGTFTREGTWKAASAELAELARIGITVIELMPVVDFAGEFGWSYDGVDFFAPTRVYGTPDDMRRFVAEAHRVGLGVILDVVYNHVGPCGNFLNKFAADYISKKHGTEWGDSLNFDGPNSAAVRDFVTSNVRYWIEEFHLDGLRLDATQALRDDSPEHIIAAMGRAAREAAGERRIILVAESEPQDSRLAWPTEQGGFGLDGLWNDDFHHTALVRLTGRNEAYYTDYLGSMEEFLAVARWGYLFQGQYYRWQKQRRGQPTMGISPSAFINYLENHDQVANSARGARVRTLTSPSRWRAMTAFLLLAPGTPMLFQGQEFGATTPFLYFADADDERAKLLVEGRAKFLAQFPSLALPEMQRSFAEPAKRETFNRAKLDFGERERNQEIYRLHQDLLRLRRQDPVIRQQPSDQLHGATLSADALLLRYFGSEGEDRLLIFNFGRDLHYWPAPQPLLAPPWESSWKLLWSSEDPAYGGTGTPELDTSEGWHIPGEAAVVLKSVTVAA